jgi:hypothetical protein
MISNSNGRTLTAHTGDNKWTAESAAKRVESICAQRRSLKCKHCGATSSHVPDLTKLECLENSVVEVKCRSCPRGGRKTGKLYLCLDCGRFNVRKHKLTHDSDCGKEDGGGLITKANPPTTHICDDTIIQRVRSICTQSPGLECNNFKCTAKSWHVPDLTKLKSLENSLIEIECRSCRRGKLWCCLDCGKYNLRKHKVTHTSDCGKELDESSVTRNDRQCKRKRGMAHAPDCHEADDNI